MSRRVASPEEWGAIAGEEWDLSLCPCGFQIAELFGVSYRTGQSGSKMQFAVEIRKIIDRCNKSGILGKYLDKTLTHKDIKRCRRESCRHCHEPGCQRALDDDLLAFKRILIAGGFPCD